MTNTKMTQVSALRLAVDVITNVVNGVNTELIGSEFSDTELTEALAKLSDMADKLAEKRSTPSKADKEKSAEHKAIADEIVLTLANTEGGEMTITEMQKASEELAKFSNQKISAIVRKMIDSGTIVKTVNKKKSYFSLAVNE